VRFTDVPVVLATFWTTDPDVLERSARRVYDTAIASGWTVPGVRCSRWTKAGVAHYSTGFGLVDPADGHGEADAVFTDGKWTSGSHWQSGQLPKRIGYYQFRNLAVLPPGRYEETDGEDDGATTEGEPVRSEDVGTEPHRHLVADRHVRVDGRVPGVVADR
jgi:hypothetical protein